MWTGLYLMIGGLVIGLGAFGFVLINLAWRGSKLSLENDRGFKSLFLGHVSAMTVMFLGGLIWVIGAVVALVNIFIELTGILNSGLL
ncbi:MAG TPA: hypothetical protein VI794_00855 [Patescibacteria group bacterium]|nr:hypothetical protein [Patescibacteria group bacterium]